MWSSWFGGEPQLTSAELWGDGDESSALGFTLQSFCTAHVGINWHLWGLPLSIQHIFGPKVIVSDKSTAENSETTTQTELRSWRKDQSLCGCAAAGSEMPSLRKAPPAGGEAQDVNLIAPSPFHAKSELFSDCWWLMWLLISWSIRPWCLIIDNPSPNERSSVRSATYRAQNIKWFSVKPGNWKSN